ncbi:MAG: multifunctional oxoglutarate decarboxylase/oxoglutarate dehydrogenase thiamine pyrophosphate-binding subunit/dihydrolipoyllysine-residue succinyltransferase subunit, partial [Kocuria sp.]|nr:multifunctional oxoglutarate decarboxylase/oxoglutarate dehydrogenase thiamine pyrophosphate-binding subunit/dihydrolipoyllysine-residue succinyltransferase subunit [Kocuria sp.]
MKLVPDQPHHQIPEEFAGNEWLVDELFEKYQQDKNSVDKKWWPIFESMQEQDSGSSAGTDKNTEKSARQAPAEPQADKSQAAKPQAAPSKPAATTQAASSQPERKSSQPAQSAETPPRPVPRRKPTHPSRRVR